MVLVNTVTQLVVEHVLLVLLVPSRAQVATPVAFVWRANSQQQVPSLVRAVNQVNTNLPIHKEVV